MRHLGQEVATETGIDNLLSFCLVAFRINAICMLSREIIFQNNRNDLYVFTLQIYDACLVKGEFFVPSELQIIKFIDCVCDPIFGTKSWFGKNLLIVNLAIFITTLFSFT